MIKQLLITGSLIIGASLWPLKAIAANFSQMIVYGDSLSDVGRTFNLTGGQVPPYGNLVGEGRFSNSLVWVEYLADHLGLPSNPNTNFAVGGATTETANTITAFLGGLEDQVTNNVINDPNALYIVWAGANDYLGGMQTDPTIPVTNLATNITTLIDNGAVNLLVVDLPDLGKLPVTLNTPNALALNQLTQFHNSGLETTLASLQTAFPQTNLTFLEINPVFNRILNNPAKFGFTNVTEACLVDQNTICSNPDQYFFWDNIHPTTKTHQLISNLALRSLGVPEPSLIIGLLVFSIGVSISHRRI